MPQDPYSVLGTTPSASDAELRAAYRRLVQLHHPDHNNGSAEAARRFEDVQEAYARVRELRRGGAGAGAGGAPRTAPRARASSAGTPPPKAATPDPELDSRLADLERELREAQQARRRAEQAAREAARAAAREATTAGGGDRPGATASDEELGYVSTDDSFAKILSDVRKEFSDRLSDARQSSSTQRAADLIEELGAVLRGERPKRSDE